jgi:hypothetical protein
MFKTKTVEVLVAGGVSYLFCKGAGSTSETVVFMLSSTGVGLGYGFLK